MRVAYAALIPALLSTTGCAPKLRTISSTKGSGEAISSIELLKSGESEILATVAKTKNHATLTSNVDAEKLVLDVSVLGESFEREIYESTPNEFQLVQMVDDTFSPPIPVMQFPMNLGDSWPWRGKVTYAGKTRDAIAAVRVAPKRTNGNIAIDVEISQDPGKGKPVVRKLSLRISPGHGIVERDYVPVSKWEALNR